VSASNGLKLSSLKSMGSILYDARSSNHDKGSLIYQIYRYSKPWSAMQRQACNKTWQRTCRISGHL